MNVHFFTISSLRGLLRLRLNLREAIVASNVPVYKELARRIGLEEMRRRVVSMEYGNGEIGTVVDEFWLTGPLRISAVEQVQFLTRLVEGTLPYSEADQLRSVSAICS